MVLSHFVKQALLNLASDTGVSAGNPSTREQWAALAHKLQVKVIHIAERDTQGFERAAEAPRRVRQYLVGRRLRQRRHGRPSSAGVRMKRSCCCAAGATISLKRDLHAAACASTRVRTWTPKAGPFHGFLITHGESISIPAYLSHREGDKVVYRPTVHYAYHPCNDAVLSVHEFAGRNWHLQERADPQRGDFRRHRRARRAARRSQEERVLVRLAALDRRSAQARAAQHGNQPQVCVAVLSGMVWAMENPKAGVIEPDEMDFRRNLEVCMPASAWWSASTATGRR